MAQDFLAVVVVVRAGGRFLAGGIVFGGWVVDVVGGTVVGSGTVTADGPGAVKGPGAPPVSSCAASMTNVPPPLMLTTKRARSVPFGARALWAIRCIPVLIRSIGSIRSPNSCRALSYHSRTITAWAAGCSASTSR